MNMAVLSRVWIGEKDISFIVLLSIFHFYFLVVPLQFSFSIVFLLCPIPFYGGEVTSLNMCMVVFFHSNPQVFDWVGEFEAR